MTDTAEEIEGLREALGNVREHLGDEVAELKAENEELRERVAELEDLVDPDPGGTEYDQLTKDQKVRQVRHALAEKATGTRNGKAQMTYKDVMWLFDGHPSAGHCYDLMERAAHLDGFNYDTPSGDGSKRVRVNIEAVNDDAVLHAVNNGGSEVSA